MKRALVLFPTDALGGAERVLRGLVRELALGGVYEEIDLFVMWEPPRGTLASVQALDGVSLRYSGASGIWGGLLPLLRVLGRKKYDLVISSNAQINAVCSAARRMGWLCTERLVARESTMIFERDFGRFGVFIPYLYRLYGAQDLIVCQTDRMRASLNHHTQEAYAGLIATLPNPIDVEMIESGMQEVAAGVSLPLPENKTCIVWCGRLAPVKSPERAVRVLAVLRESGMDDAHLVMVGDGPLRGDLEREVSALGLTEHVTFAGHQKLPSSVFSRCPMGLLTSDVEGFPNVIPEMLASGVTHVVTTQCAGNLKEIPGVTVVPLTDTVVDDLAAATLAARDSAPAKGVGRYVEQRTPAHYLSTVLGLASRER